LGLYINFWQPWLASGDEREYAVMMVNDEGTPQQGTLTLAFEKDGVPAVRAEMPFAVSAYGQQTFSVRMQAPREPGQYVLKAVASHAGDPTVSRRKVEVR
jgi:hypothetical protein